MLSNSKTVHFLASIVQYEGEPNPWVLTIKNRWWDTSHAFATRIEALAKLQAVVMEESGKRVIS